MCEFFIPVTSFFNTTFLAGIVFMITALTIAFKVIRNSGVKIAASGFIVLSGVAISTSPFAVAIICMDNDAAWDALARFISLSGSGG